MEAILRQDQKLSDHISLFELTVTTNENLQELNRTIDDDQLQKLGQLAQNDDPLQGCEAVRALCGGGPMRIHSGYRSLGLNSATKGSSSTSQHPRCEAVDFDIPGQTVEQTFDILYQAAKAGKFKFGQLIIEEADRGYKDPDGQESIAKWVHFSVIGTLAPEKVGQVMKMVQGPNDPEPVYQMVDQLKFA